MGKEMSEDTFRSQIAPKFQSTYHPIKHFQPFQLKDSDFGLSLDGLRKFLMMELEAESFREEKMMAWMLNLGYDSDLNPVRCRCFTLSLHSTAPVTVHVQDACATDVDARANSMICQHFSQVLEEREEYAILFTFSEKILAYSYYVTNKLANPIDLTLDFSKSKNMEFSARDPKLTKRVEPGQTVFMMHTRADPNRVDFSRSIKVSYREIKTRFNYLEDEL